MGILSFIDTTFILTLGIVLLICGGIMIYCYRRLNALENGLIQQGRVLQEFISNYNNSQLTTQKTLAEKLSEAKKATETKPKKNAKAKKAT